MNRNSLKVKSYCKTFTQVNILHKKTDNVADDHLLNIVNK